MAHVNGLCARFTLVRILPPPPRLIFMHLFWLIFLLVHCIVIIVAESQISTSQRPVYRKLDFSSVKEQRRTSTESLAHALASNGDNNGGWPRPGERYVVNTYASISYPDEQHLQYKQISTEPVVTEPRLVLSPFYSPLDERNLNGFFSTHSSSSLIVNKKAPQSSFSSSFSSITPMSETTEYDSLSSAVSDEYTSSSSSSSSSDQTNFASIAGISSLPLPLPSSSLTGKSMPSLPPFTLSDKILSSQHVPISSENTVRSANNSMSTDSSLNTFSAVSKSTQEPTTPDYVSPSNFSHDPSSLSSELGTTLISKQSVLQSIRKDDFFLYQPSNHPSNHHHHHHHHSTSKELVDTTQNSSTNLRKRKHAGPGWVLRLDSKSLATPSSVGSPFSTTTGAGLSNLPFNISWPLKRAVDIPGDLSLGGLMMVHERDERWTCGKIMPQGGIQALECMLYTLDWVNNHTDFLPGIKLGAYVLDDCDRDTYGLEQSIDFIKGSISNIDDGTYRCPDGTVPTIKQNPIVGVLGAASSVTSIQVANLLRLFKIPQVSFFSTSPELSNKERFEYFLRTVPSDTNQVKAMVEIIKLFNWTYVSVIYEESNYGDKAFSVMEVEFSKNKICIAIKEKLTKDSGVATSSYYERIVRKLLTKPNARGVIVFASDQEVAGVMEAVHRLRVFDHFIWIGSDGWSARSVVSQGRERAVEGTLSLQPRAGLVKGFEQYFLSLRPSTNLRNPWFVEYWETIFHCKFVNSPLTPANIRHTPYASQLEPEWFLGSVGTSSSSGAGSGGANTIPAMDISMNASNNRNLSENSGSFTAQPIPMMQATQSSTNPGEFRVCTGDEQYSAEYPHEPERQLQFVSDSVLTFAYALKQMQIALCDGRPGLCERMRPVDGARLLSYLRKVQFVGLSGDLFRFTDTQDGPVRYDLLHYRRNEQGRYVWIPVGSYEDRRLQLDLQQIRFPSGLRIPPESVCSRPCSRGQARRYVAGEQCCWHCLDCGEYDVIVPGERCEPCPPGFIPDTAQRFCQSLPVEHVGYSHQLAPPAIALASIGLLCTFSVAAVFYRHRDTPLVRASGRELSSLLMLGIAALFAYPFLALAVPNVLICGLQRVHLSLSLATVYAALLTKTNRISRVFRASAHSARPPPFISPQAQLCICGALVGIQLMFTLLWIAFQPPQVIHHYPTRESHQVACALNLSHWFLFVLAYPAVLVLVCTHQAFLTRKTPEAFNESKFIGFTMYATCVIWLAFLPIFTVIRQSLALNMLSVSCSVCGSAFAALLLLFAPKLYIILLHPEKNVRSQVKPFAGKMKPTITGASVSGDRNNNLNGTNSLHRQPTCRCVELELSDQGTISKESTSQVTVKKRLLTVAATQTSPVSTEYRSLTATIAENNFDQNVEDQQVGSRSNSAKSIKSTSSQRSKNECPSRHASQTLQENERLSSPENQNNIC